MFFRCISAYLCSKLQAACRHLYVPAPGSLRSSFATPSLLGRISFAPGGERAAAGIRPCSRPYPESARSGVGERQAGSEAETEKRSLIGRMSRLGLLRPMRCIAHAYLYLHLCAIHSSKRKRYGKITAGPVRGFIWQNRQYHHLPWEIRPLCPGAAGSRYKRPH